MGYEEIILMLEVWIQRLWRSWSNPVRIFSRECKL